MEEIKKDYGRLALKLHEKCQGKMEIKSKVPLDSKEDLSIAYTPGVAEPCLHIADNKEDVYRYTNKGNLIGIVTDGTAVLGLGDIGPEAALPVMEGKAILFKHFGNVDAFPICLDTSDPEEIVSIVKAMAPGFGGINLEDIKAPNCFYIEEQLKKQCNIPIFHDDQHGTAVVTLAGILNSVKLVDKTMSQLKVVVNGAGAAGIAITKLLLDIGVSDVFLCDTTGIIYEGRLEGMNTFKEEMSLITNREKRTGNLGDALKGSDVFIGVSVAGAVTTDMVKTMNTDSFVFAMANPLPEILPVEAKAGDAKVIATGRSDFPNQINNVLAFPGILRGALDAKASDINEAMKIAAAEAIASLVSDEELSEDYIIPSPLDERVGPLVAKKVFEAAVISGVARK
ncbi:malate dehydrogenase [endosymbiont 'TC1' of Trimyema compressum]|uniref:NAD(P)-dependent malic enzyme n=1 Tax=endosymbiont 'TC1' of Trimyema compressum TaxID=243899 RepID=UPI0007F0A390|nr:malic enzyme-like NAD(P)-binding protein [endosymbiont 'TC1' of Trimyema compressum]AMP20160.1 malate dehydrogenase [endosymbiont 'TC1' of Trimyema compressum]